MICPACNAVPLKSLHCEGQEVDLCRRCGGTWFDRAELLAVIKQLIAEEKIDEQTLREAYREKHVATESLPSLRRKCPRCGIDMDLRNFSYDSNIIIDQCPRCDGIWTDAGELRAAARYIKGSPEMTAFGKSLVEVNKACLKTRSRTGRIIASVIALAYLGWGFSVLGLPGLIKTIAHVFLPIVCIFYGEELGGMTGGRLRPTFFAPVVTKSSPGIIITFLGWVYLILIPIVVVAIMAGRS